jgi:Lrp/AsnC family transcriptional regulator, leucine-responsive regulatory protein
VLVHVTMTVGNRASDMAEFEARVAELDDVIECRRMFGDPDYLLWVAVADLATYETLYMDRLVSLPGVARTSSQLTMRTIKAGGRIPL